MRVVRFLTAVVLATVAGLTVAAMDDDPLPCSEVAPVYPCTPSK